MNQSTQEISRTNNQKPKTNYKLSKSGRRLFSNIFLIVLFFYLVSPFGATFLGVVNADMYTIALTMMTITLGVWVWIRVKHNWLWHRTAFDWIFVLWGVAFVISVLANVDTTRRSLIGLWYMLLYIGVWYVLHDALANRGITRQQLVNALLSTGVIIVLFSLIQATTQPSFTLPVSLIGNTNALGAVLLGMCPFAVTKILTTNNRVMRAIWAVYGLALVANLLLTLSRGAWVGLFSAFGIMILLLLKHYDMLSWSALKMWWHVRSSFQKYLLSGSVLSLVVVILIAGGLLINSFSLQGRRPELRTRLWNSAISQFSEKPMTGQGFYTFGRDYGLSISIPPEQSHSHAHSLPLNILAEMGIIGFIVFCLTIGWMIRLIIKCWNSIEGDERILWITAIATLTGFLVQHLFDLPAMMPIVALVGMLVLVLVCAPHHPQVMIATWRMRGHPIGMTLLWLGLLITGAWSGHIYKDYLDAMRVAFAPTEEAPDTQRLDNLRMTALLLDDVITRDPMMPIYHQQQALVWGFLAESGDEVAIQNGIYAYQDFLALEPNHAISWANLSALQWQANNIEGAVASIEKAIELAPRYRLFQNNLQVYQGDLIREAISVPGYRYNSNFASLEFLREPLNTTFLPQVGWATHQNN